MGLPGRGWNANPAMRRREGVDLFSIFSGALAVQESLQLDAMTADQPGAMPPGRRQDAAKSSAGRSQCGPARPWPARENQRRHKNAYRPHHQKPSLGADACRKKT